MTLYSVASLIDRRPSTAPLPTSKLTSSFTDLVSSRPAHLMAVSVVTSLLSRDIDTSAHNTVTTVSSFIDREVGRLTRDRRQLHSHQRQTSPTAPLHLMSSSSVVYIISRCVRNIKTMTLINTPSHIDLGHGRHTLE